MLCYNRIQVSEGTNVNKTSGSYKCIICHYWYFSEKRFRFESFVCNRCRDVLTMSNVINIIDILNTHGVDYCYIALGIRKSEATYKYILKIRIWMEKVDLLKILLNLILLL